MRAPLPARFGKRSALLGVGASQSRGPSYQYHSGVANRLDAIPNPLGLGQTRYKRWHALLCLWARKPARIVVLSQLRNPDRSRGSRDSARTRWVAHDLQHLPSRKSARHAILLFVWEVSDLHVHRGRSRVQRTGITPLLAPRAVRHDVFALWHSDSSGVCVLPAVRSSPGFECERGPGFGVDLETK